MSKFSSSSTRIKTVKNGYPHRMETVCRPYGEQYVTPYIQNFSVVGLDFYYYLDRGAPHIDRMWSNTTSRFRYNFGIIAYIDRISTVSGAVSRAIKKRRIFCARYNRVQTERIGYRRNGVWAYGRSPQDRCAPRGWTHSRSDGGCGASPVPVGSGEVPSLDCNRTGPVKTRARDKEYPRVPLSCDARRAHFTKPRIHVESRAYDSPCCVATGPAHHRLASEVAWASGLSQIARPAVLRTEPQGAACLLKTT